VNYDAEVQAGESSGHIVEFMFLEHDVFRSSVSAFDLLLPGADPITQVVDLVQIAARVNLTKKAMERYKTRKTDPLPDPDFSGGGGRKDQWRWSTVRPWLVRTFRIPQPEQYPQPSMSPGTRR
jgi:hypothetical protein